MILLLSGPNLNLLGQREPDVYGRATLEDHVGRARAVAAAHGQQLEHLQSNREGDLIEAVHGARRRGVGIVINPGAFTHYAWGLHDALAAFEGPVVELHVSNPNRREPWRHTSVVSPVATGTISGFGGDGYELAVEAVARLLAAADAADAGATGQDAAAAPAPAEPTPADPSPADPTSGAPI